MNLSPGIAAPTWSLTNQHGALVSSSDQLGHRLFVYFYPKADTPGCTEQSCLLRDVAGTIGDTVIVGVSPDHPATQAKFDNKHSLGFPLLADTDHVMAEAFGVWQEKLLYGKRYMGIVRSAFLIDAEGVLEGVWYKISPKGTPSKLLEALR